MLRTLGLGTVLVAWFGVGWATQGWAQEARPQNCVDCHDRVGGTRLSGPPSELLARSIHKDLDCTACHQSISMASLEPTSTKPHGEKVEPVRCGECHEE